MKNTKTRWASAYALAQHTGCGRQHIPKWCELDSVPSIERNGTILYDRAKAIAAIEDHRRPRRDGGPAEDQEVTLYTVDPAQMALKTKAQMLLLNCVYGLIDAIQANSPNDVPGEVPDKVPQFTLEQGLWLMNELAKPIAGIKKLMKESEKLKSEEEA